MDWRRRAACVHEDPELFFPDGDVGQARAQVQEAKAVCGRCPVIDICLAWALSTRQEVGVWGGHSEDELRGLRRPVARTRRVG